MNAPQQQPFTMTEKPGLRHTFLVLASLVLLLLPLALTEWRAQGALRNERREREPWPAWPTLLPEWETFPDRFDMALSYRVGLRNLARETWAALHYFLFAESVDPRVLIGKGSWLFYADKEEPIRGHVDEVADAVENSPMPADKLLNILGKIQNRYEWAKERGVAYRLVVAPNKTTLYRKYGPSWMTPRGRGRPATQLEHAFNKWHPSHNPWLNLEPYLRQVPETTNIFFLTDTHWNEIGAFHGVAAIARNLEPEFPGLRKPQLSDFNITWVSTSRLDLARMLGLPDQIHEQQPVLRAKPGIELPEFQRNMKVLVYHDSFGIFVAPIWRAYFPNSEFHQFKRFDREEIESKDAKIVLSIMVERNLRDRHRYW